ncbi:hypothetical protein B0T18DRAFT_424408 [Schizothecium vesticola]|uniref:Uncharacterized protein n=1 Tax=Schizothecium vesticola TaxID=314040 RepID=A0AA40FA97_9PEZI|nr:hypothetical protein B0T18DRAFT_424408 [Schizothecium vesticola]
MAGGFVEINEDQCRHYAGFAAHLDRHHFDAAYWVLFMLVVLMLFTASYKYSSYHDKAKDLEPGTRAYRSRMNRCLYQCLAYFLISLAAVVIEIFILMALQFCDGEDLMSLYWSTWTVLQLGSLVAIAGVLLSVYNNMHGNKNPPWALALGTPVLVVAGIGHAVHTSIHKQISRTRSRSRSRGRRPRAMSVSSGLSRLEGVKHNHCHQQPPPTYDSDKEDAEFRAKLVGYTPDGAPILQFVDDPGVIRPERGSVLGRGDNGMVIVGFRREGVVVTTAVLGGREGV